VSTEKTAADGLQAADILTQTAIDAASSAAVTDGVGRASRLADTAVLMAGDVAGDVMRIPGVTLASDNAAAMSLVMGGPAAGSMSESMSGGSHPTSTVVSHVGAAVVTLIATWTGNLLLKRREAAKATRSLAAAAAKVESFSKSMKSIDERLDRLAAEIAGVHQELTAMSSGLDGRFESLRDRVDEVGTREREERSRDLVRVHERIDDVMRRERRS
jgi:ubiquinone biosynthesis protein UbiJ